jgi:hypothetical protein
MTKPISVYESYNVVSLNVDTVVRVQQLNGLTHIAFAETRPSIDNAGQERPVVARLVIPDALVSVVARTILAGVAAGGWVMSHEENLVRHDH